MIGLRGGSCSVMLRTERRCPAKKKKQNKQCFINMVSEKLKEAGCYSIHAAGDADVLIAQSAVSVTATRDTVVIADDTQTF